MSVLQELGRGFGVALQPLNIILAGGGVSIGTMVGMLPGIGPINAIAILFPITFAAGLPPESVLIFLVGIYYGSQYGNSISTILLNVPGTSSAVVTAIDGYALTLKGESERALAVAAMASFVGGTLSVVGLVFFAPVLAQVAVRFGPAEYFALMLFALTALSSLGGDNVFKGLIALGFGLLLASVGIDPQSAVPRFTFGQLGLLDGIDFVVVVIGMFAVSEVLLTLERGEWAREKSGRIRLVWMKMADFSGTIWTMVRSAVVGFFVGVLPGAGGTVAAFLGYSTEQKLVDREGTFGKGDPRGVAAPEAANNAAANGSMIPLLTLGIPGSSTTAVLLGALTALDVTPGPMLLTTRPEVFWGLVASMYVGNLLLLALNLPLVGFFARLLQIPRWALMPGVAVLSVTAVYALNQSVFDVFLMIGFGFVGLVFRKASIPLAPAILGLVLGPLMEKNLRRSLALSGGDWEVLFSSWIAIAFWILAALLLVVPSVTSGALRRWAFHLWSGSSASSS
ncbi:MAG: tripartite tricarboxylate transporter permease [Gemmatimonadetes bacterium]|nr:tripartite tricarboxylate transporter permease [Gemmatimonadota bacterium]NNM05763.1 tripartite tricarboxylate transporter permease [Gemmatimonadota bacterium]